VTAPGGQYRLCWCAGIHFPCSIGDDYRVDLGELVIIGPSPVSEQHRTCVSGQTCSFDGLRGTDLGGANTTTSDKLWVLETCGVRPPRHIRPHSGGTGTEQLATVLSATASSIAFGGVPTYLVDGRSNAGEFIHDRLGGATAISAVAYSTCAHTLDVRPEPSWFLLDLERVRVVSGVTLAGRTDCSSDECIDSSNGITVRVGHTNPPTRDDPICISNVDAYGFQPLAYVSCDNNLLLAGRYVSLWRYGMLVLCEVQVWVDKGALPERMDVHGGTFGRYGWPNGGQLVTVTRSGQSYNWQSEPLTPAGGVYRLCWCADSYACSTPEHFRVDWGALTIVGPSPAGNQDRTSVAGQTCSMRGMRGVH
jgi:hypothetical protein